MNAKGGILLIVAIALLVAGAVFGFRLFRDGSPTDRTGEHLQRLEDSQRDLAGRVESIRQGLDRSARTVEAIAGRVDEVEGTVAGAQGRIESGAVHLGESQRRIEAGQRILQEIRQRGQAKDKKP